MDVEEGMVAEVTEILTIFSSSLSILGVVGIFALYARYPTLRTPSKTLLLFLTVADFLTASGNMSGTVRYIAMSGHNVTSDDEKSMFSDWCTAQSVVTTYSSMASFFWTAAISFFILMPVAKDVIFGRSFLIVCHVVSWGLPGAIIIYALVHEDQPLKADVGNTGTASWCWIREFRNSSDSDEPDWTQLNWQLMTGKFWEILVYVITALNYMLLKFYLHKRKRDRGDTWDPFAREVKFTYKFTKWDKNFLFVPIVLYLLRLWGTIRYFLQFASSDEARMAALTLKPIQGYGDSGQAFWNFVLFFVLDGDVRSAVFGTSPWRLLLKGVAPYGAVSVNGCHTAETRASGKKGRSRKKLSTSV